MTFIYVLQLEEGKWYIGKTDSSKFRIETHFDNNGSEFTKKYKPEEIYQIIPECDKYDEDKYVKKYMDKYGIDNVRGGSYSRLELEEDEKRLIQKELWAANDLCFLCGGDHFIKECPSKKQIKEETEMDELKNVEELKEEERDKYIKYYEDMLFELTEGCWVSVSYDIYSSNLDSKYYRKTDSTYPTKIYTKYDTPPIDFENIKEIKYLLDGREINTFSGKVLVREHKPRYYSIAIIFNEVNCGKNNYIYYTYKFGPFKFDRFLLNGQCNAGGDLWREDLYFKKNICEYNLFMLKNAVFSSKTSLNSEYNKQKLKYQAKIENCVENILEDIDIKKQLCGTRQTQENLCFEFDGKISNVTTTNERNDELSRIFKHIPYANKKIFKDDYNLSPNIIRFGEENILCNLNYIVFTESYIYYIFNNLGNKCYTIIFQKNNITKDFFKFNLHLLVNSIQNYGIEVSYSQYIPTKPKTYQSEPTQYYANYQQTGSFAIILED